MGPKGALGATKLLRPFVEIVDSLELKDPFIRNWIDLLAFLLAGVKSDGILSAEMVTIEGNRKTRLSFLLCKIWLKTKSLLLMCADLHVC